ncbi:hypothetical protein EDD17DRAFT_1624067 [Pisolithus thermaeus]|nr:hypothetical protein EDD17DRAFT_1624067 [Pisolithus thermaeus]
MQFAHSHCHQMYFPSRGCCRLRVRSKLCSACSVPTVHGHRDAYATVYHDHSHIPTALLYRPKDLGCLELRTGLTVKNSRRLRLSVAQIEKAGKHERGRDLRWTTTSGERKGAVRGEVTTRTEAWHALFLTRADTTMISPQTRGTTSISSDVMFAKIGRQYSDEGSSTMKAA